MPLILTEKEKVLLAELQWYKKDAVSAAEDFKYGPEVIYKIQRARSINEITRIMKTAREAN